MNNSNIYAGYRYPAKMSFQIITLKIYYNLLTYKNALRFITSHQKQAIMSQSILSKLILGNK